MDEMRKFNLCTALFILYSLSLHLIGEIEKRGGGKLQGCTKVELTPNVELWLCELNFG